MAKGGHRRRAAGVSVGAWVALLALTGCGAEEAGSPPVPTASSVPATPKPDPAPDPASARVDLVAQTAGRGTPTTTAARLDAGGRDAFLATLADPQARRVGRRIEVRADAGAWVWAAVVAVGCDVPAQVRVLALDADSADLAVVPPASPRPECFAPVVTVAVVSAPAPS